MPSENKGAERSNSLDLSFPLRGIRQIRDRSENRMRFSERSSNLDVRDGFPQRVEKTLVFSYSRKRKIEEGSPIEDRAPLFDLSFRRLP